MIIKTVPAKAQRRKEKLLLKDTNCFRIKVVECALERFQKRQAARPLRAQLNLAAAIIFALAAPVAL